MLDGRKELTSPPPVITTSGHLERRKQLRNSDSNYHFSPQSSPSQPGMRGSGQLKVSIANNNNNRGAASSSPSTPSSPPSGAAAMMTNGRNTLLHSGPNPPLNNHIPRHKRSSSRGYGEHSISPIPTPPRATTHSYQASVYRNKSTSLSSVNSTRAERTSSAGQFICPSPTNVTPIYIDGVGIANTMSAAGTPSSMSPPLFPSSPSSFLRPPTIHSGIQGNTWSKEGGTVPGQSGSHVSAPDPLSTIPDRLQLLNSPPRQHSAQSPPCSKIGRRSPVSAGGVCYKKN